MADVDVQQVELGVFQVEDVEGFGPVLCFRLLLLRLRLVDALGADSDVPVVDGPRGGRLVAPVVALDPARVEVDFQPTVADPVAGHIAPAQVGERVPTPAGPSDSQADRQVEDVVC